VTTAVAAGQPVFWLLAGPNGAGKSTLYRALVLQGLISTEAEFVNADLYEQAALGHIADPEARSNAAREWADARRAALLKEGRSFVSETVFSHPSKLDLIDRARAAGFIVHLLVVAIDDPRRLVARVRQRVGEGGHDVPAKRIVQRYPRTLANLAHAVRRADIAMLYDSHDVQPGTHRMVALCRGELTRVLHRPLPQWARTVLGSAGD
jgi:predicted ABC-type ATPase